MFQVFLSRKTGMFWTVLQQLHMKFKERDASSKRKYSKISISKRKRLIEAVMHQGQSLVKTTKKLNINLSTARLILKRYKAQGNFHMKNFKHPPKQGRERQVLAEKEELIESQEILDEASQSEKMVGSSMEGPEAQKQVTDEQNVPIYQYYWYYVPYYFST